MTASPHNCRDSECRADTTVLQEIYDAVNALGGRSDQDNSYDQGIVDTVAKVLEIIERKQGKHHEIG